MTESDWDLTNACKNCVGLDIFIRESLRKAFWKMNDLSRDHIFWNNSNKLPTFHKLSYFADFLINDNIDQVLGAYTHIFMSLINGGDHLITSDWQILKRFGVLNSNWLVNTAWNQSALWSDLNIGRFSDLIAALNIADDIEPQLSALELSGDEIEIKSLQWVSKVRSKVGVA